MLPPFIPRPLAPSSRSVGKAVGVLLRTFYEAGGSLNQQTAEVLYAYSYEDLLPFKSAAAVPVPVEAAGEAAASAGFDIGACVEGKWRDRASWYPATVTGCKRRGSQDVYNLEYADGGKESNVPAKRIRPFVDIVSIVGEEVWEYLRVNPNARLLTDHACAVDAESVTDAARVLPIADLTAPSELGSIVILGTITFEYTAGTKKVCVASRCCQPPRPPD